MLSVLMLAALTQPGDCRFKADWWLPVDVDARTANGAKLGVFRARFDTDVPAPKAEVVLRKDVAEISLAHRGAHVKFSTSKLPVSTATRMYELFKISRVVGDAVMINGERVLCSELRLFIPSPSKRAKRPKLVTDETSASDEGERTAERLRNQIEVEFHSDVSLKPRRIGTPRTSSHYRVKRLLPELHSLNLKVNLFRPRSGPTTPSKTSRSSLAPRNSGVAAIRNDH